MTKIWIAVTCVFLAVAVICMIASVYKRNPNFIYLSAVCCIIAGTVNEYNKD